ncbi:MAG: V-type ATP synthase subunit A, partial [Gaiellaceae bacterium]
MTALRVRRVNGPVVELAGAGDLAMLELVRVGEARLPGEVIALAGDVATVQVYEYTGGLRPGEPATASGAPLSAQLGPGLLGGVFDGMLRRLDGAGDWIETGAQLPTLVADRRWQFEPVGSLRRAEPGALLGRVRETEAIEHRVHVPPGISGTLEWLAPAGELTVADPVARIDGQEIALAHRWPVRRPRPVSSRLHLGAPLTTGQRALDLFFPIALGSTAAVPGGFGTGKTVLLQQIAKHCDADVIVYVGCGERGNEMADVLEELPRLEDPRTGRPLMERTVLIANTSNMPVLAREMSIYTGITVAEYYRDLGYDSVLIADSTSRWAEALREVSSRTGELPAEEGYPAGLASQLAG